MLYHVVPMKVASGLRSQVDFYITKALHIPLSPIKSPFSSIFPSQNSHKDHHTHTFEPFFSASIPALGVKPRFPPVPQHPVGSDATRSGIRLRVFAKAGACELPERCLAKGYWWWLEIWWEQSPCGFRLLQWGFDDIVSKPAISSSIICIYIYIEIIYTKLIGYMQKKDGDWGNITGDIWSY